jgi:NAD-reducing hydrogenase large subunit
MVGIAQLGLSVAKDWLSKNQDTVNRFANFSSMYMGMTNDGALELYDGPVRLIDAQGKKVVEYDPRDYLDYVQERTEDWTYLKFPYYKPMGWPQGVYRVAPLARLNIADRITTPLANEELKSFKALAEGPVQATLYYHYARLIEALYGLEQIQVLCDDPDILSEDILNTRIQITGHGVGVIEAPRGTLWHDYHTDENGVLTRVNLIVATGNNNWAMSNAVDTVAKEFVKGSGVTEGMLNRVEAAIRAYDPCLSCSTHAVGQMPMIIEVVDAAGEPLERFVRN